MVLDGGSDRRHFGGVISRRVNGRNIVESAHQPGHDCSSDDEQRQERKYGTHANEHQHQTIVE